MHRISFRATARAFHEATDLEFDVEVAAEWAAGGNQDALASLYGYFSEKVLRYFIVRVHDTWLADDLASETWTKVARSIKTFTPSPDSGFTAWLFTVARNVHTDRARHHNRRPEQLRGEWLELDTASDADTPEQASARRAAADALAEAVNTLPQQQAQVLQHLFFTGLTIGETAALTGKTTAAIRKAQHDALKNLRRRMGGLDLSELAG